MCLIFGKRLLHVKTKCQHLKGDTMEPPIDQRICHACGEIYFTLLQQFENEITAKCNNCEAKVTFSSAKDLTITEG
jgi:hypothetical protein